MEGMKRQIGTEFLLLLLLMMMWCGDSQQASHDGKFASHPCRVLGFRL
jgi:hypothetical protein